MNLFDVYPLYDVTPVTAKGIEVIDDKGETYLDFYGGHAVISIGHAHPHYTQKLKTQLDAIGFYSNSIKNPLQLELANKLGDISGYGGYALFLCNSGAEANENALKLASFHTGRSKVIAFENGFHGRTSAAVAVTDNPNINAPINRQQQVDFLPLNDFEALERVIAKEEHCAVILETVQGVGGLDEPTTEFFQFLGKKCREHGVVLIADEVQSGYGRTGKFFAFQHHLDTEQPVQKETDVDLTSKPDIISMAKGMGNGFPIGGILVSDTFKASYGLLGTTFGGNHLACAAGIAVLDVIKEEGLIANAYLLGTYFKERALEVPQIKSVKGRGLMLGLEFDFEVADLRKRLIFNQHMFTGGSSNKKLLRFLPALNTTKEQIDVFFGALKRELE